LANSVAEKTKANGMTCKSVAIIAILTDLSMHSKSKTLESSTSDGSVIESSSKQLIEELLRSMPDAVLRRVGVRVSDLMKPTGQTDISKFLTA
jgi:nucleotidyltransferase/DNA polymerase involved in DNA repair